MDVIQPHGCWRSLLLLLSLSLTQTLQNYILSQTFISKWHSQQYSQRFLLLFSCICLKFLMMFFYTFPYFDNPFPERTRKLLRNSAHQYQEQRTFTFRLNTHSHLLLNVKLASGNRTAPIGGIHSIMPSDSSPQQLLVSFLD